MLLSICYPLGTLVNKMFPVMGFFPGKKKSFNKQISPIHGNMR